MKFVCDRCQTKYSIADDKVRGKVLKVRCKTCQNVITVREPGARPSVNSLAPIKPAAAAKPPTGPMAVLGENHDELSERTAIAAVPAAFMAELAQQQPRRATPPPPPPLGDGIEWFLALEGAQQGPFTRKLLVDRLLTMPKDADVHVWNDQMDGWKPPKDVPDVARDLAARKPPQVPVRPPVPRLTPAPPVPPLGARRGTQPLTSGVGSKLPSGDHHAKLPAPVAAAAHAHAVPAPHALHEDPAVGQETPGPAAIAPAGRTRKPTNGVGTHAAAPNGTLGGESDALSALNIHTGGAAAAVAVAPAPSVAVRNTAPRLMEVSDATAWAGQGRVSEGRSNSTKMAVGLLALVGVIIVVATLSMTSKKSTAVTFKEPKPVLDTSSLGQLADDVHKEVVTPPKPGVQPPQAETGGGRGHVRPPVRGGRLPTRTGQGQGTTNTQVAGPPPGEADVGRAVVPIAPVHHNRPPPSQGDISRVINNNKIGIKTCYQRALLRDSSLTHGKIVVGLTIGTSGRVRGTHVDGPVAFRALEPCIKEMVGRWSFPQSDEEYGTEFAYVFQGNE
jgi:predicted Zn finger-like uncharacterized protein